MTPSRATDVKLAAALIAIALLLGVAAYAVSQETASSKLVLKLVKPHGLHILDAAGIDDTNVTVTVFGVNSVVGGNFTRGYQIKNDGPTTATVTNIVAVPESGGTAAEVEGITFPLVLAAGSAAPFSVFVVILPAGINDTSATIDITATATSQ